MVIVAPDTSTEASLSREQSTQAPAWERFGIGVVGFIAAVLVALSIVLPAVDYSGSTIGPLDHPDIMGRLAVLSTLLVIGSMWALANSRRLRVTGGGLLLGVSSAYAYHLIDTGRVIKNLPEGIGTWCLEIGLGLAMVAGLLALLASITRHGLDDSGPQRGTAAWIVSAIAAASAGLFVIGWGMPFYQGSSAMWDGDAVDQATFAVIAFGAVVPVVAFLVSRTTRLGRAAVIGWAGMWTVLLVDDLGGDKQRLVSGGRLAVASLAVLGIALAALHSMDQNSDSRA